MGSHPRSGVVDEPVPGGLSLADAEQIIRVTAERFRIRATTLATFTPGLDRDGKTLRLGLRLIEILGGCIRNVKEPVLET
jgi:arginase family enzyme